jgi:hypothetical protein
MNHPEPEYMHSTDLQGKPCILEYIRASLLRLLSPHGEGKKREALKFTPLTPTLSPLFSPKILAFPLN